MPTRIQLQHIADNRMEDIKSLLKEGRYDAAKYLSGYIVETGLKACICKTLDIDYPDKGDISKSFLTHNLDNLVKLAGLSKKMTQKRAIDKQFNDNWNLVSDWNESMRYDPIATYLLTDIENIIIALEDNSSGILTWIKTQW